MRHRVKTKKLNRTSSHRKALISNMLVSLVKYEKITTTKEKAKLLKRHADSMIHKAKTDTVHSRRVVAKYLKDPKALSKLFNEIAPRFQNRNGGYVKKILSYKRYGDNSEMCVVMICATDSVASTSESKK